MVNTWLRVYHYNVSVGTLYAVIGMPIGDNIVEAQPTIV